MRPCSSCRAGRPGRWLTGVGEFLSLEIAGRLVIIAAILAAETLDGSQRLKQGAVNGEVIVGEQPSLLGLALDLFQKPGADMSKWIGRY